MTEVFIVTLHMHTQQWKFSQIKTRRKTDTCLMAFFRDNLDKLAAERLNQSGF